MRVLENEILHHVDIRFWLDKYLPKENRRENWDELVTRNMDMHIKKYPKLANEILDAYQYVQDKKPNV